jgi:hypothetical protein
VKIEGYQQLLAESAKSVPGRDKNLTKSLIAQVAQSVEQRIENPRVGSSILSLGTIALSQ